LLLLFEADIFGLALYLLLFWTNSNLGEQAKSPGEEYSSRELVLSNENNETKLRMTNHSKISLNQNFDHNFAIATFYLYLKLFLFLLHFPSSNPCLPT